MAIRDGAYLDSEPEWDQLVEEVRRAGVAGLDTEFYGMDPSEKSCFGRARIHVWSVAIRTPRLSPLGFHYCRGWCLPVRALDYQPIRDLLEGSGGAEGEKIRWEIHNQSVDQHALANHGITLRGARNTLDLIRWARPELINFPGRFKLKTLMQRLLLRAPVCTFKQLVGYRKTTTVTKRKLVEWKVCSCGADGCRKRKAHKNAPWEPHTKSTKSEWQDVSREKEIDAEYPLEEIIPGHPRWELLVRYAIEDAIAALQIGEIADAAEDPAPWPYEYQGSAPLRPCYDQRVIDAVIDMEQVGFRVDVPWCTETAKRAEADEEKELAWLFKWFVANAPYEGPHHRKLGISTKQAKKHGVDSVWSSPQKKLALFDEIGFPRSPIWAKGKVKRGEAKLDWKALDWIANNHPPAKQVCEHINRLAKIRSGKKYLIKLRDSGGMVHPICGPAGDEDERSGAVTGRLGVKGELEAQQLPTRDGKDLYLVRKAIIA